MHQGLVCPQRPANAALCSLTFESIKVETKFKSHPQPLTVHQKTHCTSCFLRASWYPLFQTASPPHWTRCPLLCSLPHFHASPKEQQVPAVTQCVQRAQKQHPVRPQLQCSSICYLSNRARLGCCHSELTVAGCGGLRQRHLRPSADCLHVCCWWPLTCFVRTLSRCVSYGHELFPLAETDALCSAAGVWTRMQTKAAWQHRWPRHQE